MKMWESLDKNPEAWDEIVQATVVTDAIQTAISHCMYAAWRFNEVYVGGDESSCMLQLLAAGETPDDRNIDVIAHVLVPTDPVDIIYKKRGPEVLKLLASFWTWRPTSPVLIQSNSEYKPLLCDIEGYEWTLGRLSAAHIAKLMSSESLSFDTSKVRIFAEVTKSNKHTAEEERAAIVRRPSTNTE